MVNVSLIEEVYGVSLTNNLGTGVAINTNGTILTAFDLVARQHGWFPSQWTPRGQIIVGLPDGRRVAANLAAADQKIGIAVLKISAKYQLKPATTDESYEVDEGDYLINVEWPPIETNAKFCSPRPSSHDIIYLYGKLGKNSHPAHKLTFGGPIVTYHGGVVGITQRKTMEDVIFATPIETALKMVRKLNLT